jgi:uncharacterized protein with NRDE domain
MAGQDQRAGGTWLGVTAEGRWAVLTNIPGAKLGSVSRGQLVVDYLARRWDVPPQDDYAGYNLLLGRPGRVDYFSSLAPHRRLDFGRYSLSNVPLGQACERAEKALSSGDLEGLAIRTPDYGLRSVTRLTLAHHGTIEERTYPSGDYRCIEFKLDDHFRPD